MKCSFPLNNTQEYYFEKSERSEQEYKDQFGFCCFLISQIPDVSKLTTQFADQLVNLESSVRKPEKTDDTKGK